MAVISRELADPAPAVAAPATAQPGMLRERLRADWRWLALCLTALLLLTACPYLVAARYGPPGLVRVGTFWFFRDFTQYLGAMRDAAVSGTWLLSDRFSAEAHRPILMYLPYVALGKLAAALGTDPLRLYYPLEVVARVALALALYIFVAAFLPCARQRRLAYLLALFTLGLEAWVIPARLLLGAIGRQDLVAALTESVDVFLEMHSFGVFLSAPHLMLGLALTLLLPVLYLRLADGGRWWLVPLGTLALGLVHPFNLPVAVSVLGVDALWQLRQGRARPFWVLLAAALAAAPVALYNAWLFTFDPFWSGTYGAQNLMPSPSPATAWVDFGLVLLAAPFGLWRLRPWRQPEQRLLLLWTILTFAAMYLPVLFQRRLGFGLQPALAVAAAVALVALQDRMRSTRLGTRPANYVLTLLALNTSVLVYVSLLASAASNHPSPVYLWTAQEQEAADWLAQHSASRDVVLSSIEAGNALVGTIPGRVVVGHIVATLHAREKEALARRFFASDTPLDERARLLADSQATVVFYGPQERRLGQPDLEALPTLERVYQNDGVTLYRVRGTT